MKKIGIILLAFCASCSGEVESTQSSENEVAPDSWTAPLTELSDEEYPNDPCVPQRHSSYQNGYYSALNLERNENGSFEVVLLPLGDNDTLKLEGIELLEWMPTICKKVGQDEYLSEIAIINQEWNRQQVRFNADQFIVSGSNEAKIMRIDLARNCLNAYLWEIIVYAEENEETKAYYHAWFDFPHQLYADLFLERNNVSFDTYKTPLEDWVEPEHKKIELEELREVHHEYTAEFVNLNDEQYPLSGERKKKFVNIMHPKNTTKMSDFLTDSTVFATFSPPGFYNQEDPRSTELSRLADCNKITVRILQNYLAEFELNFNQADENATNLVISGIDLDEIPVLPQEDANNGWMSSMGFGNHQFYETYEHTITHSSIDSEYFAFLSDGDYNWLDSHAIGIDGPLLHWRDESKSILDFWILSFERHAFVGHYAISILPSGEQELVLR